MSLRSPLCILSLLVVNAALPAQAPMPPPQMGRSALLYTRFLGPEGMHVSFSQGRVPGKDYPAPVVVGLRPGYIYRVKLSGLPGYPGVELFPTLEVRGTLCLPPNLRAADYPVPLLLTTEDIERIVGGTMLTKVLYLEDPLQAVPTATRPDRPLETEARPGVSPIDEARQLGRVMVIVRIGGRDLTPEEMAREAIPGTVLLPGEKVLGPPAVKPFVPWGPIALFDPLLGPRPAEEECLPDGGDTGVRVGLDPQGQILGLDPADTAAAYTDARGRRQLAVSNRVCVCVPRFAVVRAETRLVGYELVTAPAGRHGVQEQIQVRHRTPSLQTQQQEQPEALRLRLRASEAAAPQVPQDILRIEVLTAHEVPVGLGEVLGTNAAHLLTLEQRARLVRQIELARLLSQPYGTRAVDQVVPGPSVIGRVEGTNVVATVQETRDVTVCCKEPLPPDKPLVLFKWVDRQAAQVGDVVTFYLKYSNLGGRPISDVAVADSLNGRLEYIPGSARSNRDAVFTTQENQAGSLILRWEIGGKLQPGDSGIVTFQVRIR